MKSKSTLLTVLMGASFILPSLGDPATRLIKNEVTEASAGLAMTEAVVKKMGFAAHLPKNTEGYFSILGGYDMYQRLLKTELGKVMSEMMADQGENLEEFEEIEEFQMFKAVVGEEIFAAFGDTTGDQALNLQAMNNSASFHQMKMMVKMAAMAMEEDLEPGGMQMQGLAMSMFGSILGDPEAGVQIFEKSHMPPVTIGFKVSDEEMRTQISEMMIGGVLSLFDLDENAPFDEIEMEKDGVALNGMTINGKKLADLVDENSRQEMTEFFGSRAMVDRFLAAVAKKNLNIVIGVKESYIIVYLGDSLDGLKFPAKSEDSLLANEGMSFLKDYLEKDIRMLVFGEEEAMKTIGGANEVMSSMAKGLKAGLAEADSFGDTRDIQALLGHVARVEGKIFDMFEYGRTGTVGFIEDGFKIESHGGSNLASIDTETAHNFAGLGDMDGVVFFRNSRSNPKFTSKLHDMLDSLGQATYLMASRVADIEYEGIRDIPEFREAFKMFDELAAGDLKNIWEALTTDWAQGTGDEGALIIDTRGTLPRVPEVPGVIIEKGLIPRIAYVTPVTDREKISTAWKKLEGSISNILKNLKEVQGTEIPMQEFDDNTKEGVTYYSTAIQFSTKDARPVVGLSDKHFYFSTSQKFIAEIDKNLVTGGDVPVRKGSYTRINFSAAREMADYWVKLLKENSEEIFENEYMRDDFIENLPLVEKLLGAFAQFDDMTAHTRMENGESRSSIHFNMK